MFTKKEKNISILGQDIVVGGPDSNVSFDTVAHPLQIKHNSTSTIK